MSNLILPSLDYKSLIDSLKPGQRKTIAYATEAERINESGNAFDYVTIYHHGHAIATLAPFAVWVTHQGYSTRTTAARIHRILNDNGIPYGFGIRQYSATLLGTDLKPFPGYITGAVVRMVAGEWSQVETY